MPTAASHPPNPTKRATWGATLAAAVVAAGLASAGLVINTTTHREYSENFNAPNSSGQGSGCCTIGQVPADTWYSVTTAGTGSNLVNTAPAGLSGQAWQIQDSVTPYIVQIANSGTGVNLCTSGQSVSFAGNLPDLALNNVWEYRVVSNTPATSGAPVNSMGIRFTGLVGTLNNVNFFIRGSTGAVQLSGTGTIGAGVFTLLISQVNCPGTGSANFASTGITGLGSQTLTAVAADPLTGSFNRLGIVNTAGSVGNTVWLDNYDWLGAPLPAPTLASVSPNAGSVSGGTSVTVTGTNLVTGATFTFGGTAATSITVVNPTTATMTTPAHTVGLVNVVVTNPDTQTATCTNCYTYQANPSPVITSVVPNHGGNAGGETISINGMNFVNGATVKFGTVNGLSPVFVSSGKISVTSPPQTNVAVAVVVTNPDTQISNSVCYSYGTATCVGGPGGGGGGGALVEDFEPFVVGGIPARNYYTYSSSGANINVQLCNPAGQTSGIKCLRLPSGTTGQFDSVTNLCDVGIKVSLLVTSATQVFQTVIGPVAAVDPVELVGLTISQTAPGSNYRLRADRQGTTPLVADFDPPIPPTTNTKLRFETTPCGQTITATETTTGATASIGGLIIGDTPFVRFLVNNVGAPQYMIDDINFGSPSNQGTGPGVLVAHTAVTGLVGFDADSFDNVVIARLDGCQAGDQCARTYDPSNLATLSTFNLDGGCDGHFDGVGGITTAQGYFTTFYNCKANGDTDRLHIRDTLMQAPNQAGTACTDFCDIDISTAQSNGACNSLSTVSQDLPTRLQHLGKLGVALWDWSNSQNPGNSMPRHATLAWTFTNTNTGEIGVYAITQNNNNADCAGIVSQTLSPTHAPADLCSFQDFIHGNTGIVGADQGGPTKAYSGTLTAKESGVKTVFYPDISFLQAGQSAVTYQNLRGISCATERWGCLSGSTGCVSVSGQPTGVAYTKTSAILQKVDGSIAIVTPIAGPNHSGWSQTCSLSGGLASDHQAVAMSGDGHWAAYLTGTGFNIINATNCSIRGSVVDSTPAATCCRGLKMDDTGQVLWVGAQLYIDKYDIHNLTYGRTVPPGTTPVYDGSGTGNFTQSTCTNSLGGLTTTGACDNTACQTCLTSPGGGQQATPTPTPVGGVAGSLAGCGFGFVVPGFTAAIQMAILTGFTIVLFIVGSYILVRKRDGGGLNGAVISILACIAYVLSLFLWCAPVFPLIILAVLGIIFAFIKSRSGTGA